MAYRVLKLPRAISNEDAMDKEPRELTLDDIHQAYMDIWARRVREENGDNDRRRAQKQPTGDQRGEQAA